jgi:hypothetical protein
MSPAARAGAVPRGRGASRGAEYVVAPPIVAFLIAELLLWLAAATHGFDFFNVGTWGRWDTGLYLQIEQHGYDFISCAGVKSFRPTDWCGDTGWFPGYPLLMRIVAQLGPSPALAGVLISAAFELATLYVVWRWFLGPRLTSRTFLPLVLLAVWFGGIYDHAVFPLSLTTFCLFVAVRLTLQQRWQGAGFAGAAAAFSYSTGFLVGAAIATWILLWGPGNDLRARLRPALTVGGLSLAGFGLVVLVQWLQTGVLGAFFLVQHKYGHGIHNPVNVFLHGLLPMAQGGWRTFGGAPGWEAIDVAAIVLGLGLATLTVWRREAAPARLLMVVIVAFWLFPLVIGPRVSLYRSDALVVPAVLLLARAPVAVQAGLVAVAGVLYFAMATLFFEYVLV